MIPLPAQEADFHIVRYNRREGLEIAAAMRQVRERKVVVQGILLAAWTRIPRRSSRCLKFGADTELLTAISDKLQPRNTVLDSYLGKLAAKKAELEDQDKIVEPQLSVVTDLTFHEPVLETADGVTSEVTQAAS